MGIEKRFGMDYEFTIILSLYTAFEEFEYQ